jgi:hypothetical protein
MILRAALLAAATLALAALPAQAAGRHRLPAGQKWGRCLLTVDGKTRISGRCSYRIGKGGEFFHIDGPNQIFEGIDYKNHDHGGAGDQSRDYWASVYRDKEGLSGYGNHDITATHGDPTWRLHREGACFVGSRDLGEPDPNDPDPPVVDPVRICLWRH